jgi:hypothetical protein
MTEWGKTTSDRGALLYARGLQLATCLGLSILLAAGIAALGGWGTLLGPEAVVANWDLPAGAFWYEAAGVEVGGYGWLLARIGASDVISLLGVAILAVAPAAALTAAAFAGHGRWRLLTLCLAIELLVVAASPVLIK